MSDKLTAETEDYLRRDVERIRQYNVSWHGYLTQENVVAVADRIRAMLQGCPFALMQHKTGTDRDPSLDTSRHLKPIEHTVPEENSGSGVTGTTETISEPCEHGQARLCIWTDGTCFEFTSQLPGMLQAARQARDDDAYLCIGNNGRLTVTYRNFLGDLWSITFALESPGSLQPAEFSAGYLRERAETGRSRVMVEVADPDDWAFRE